MLAGSEHTLEAAIYDYEYALLVTDQYTPKK